MEARRVVRRRGSHIFYTIGSQMAVRLSASCTGRPLAPGRFLVLISVRSCVVPRDIVRLEGLGKSKNRMTSSGIEPRDLPACTIVTQATKLPRAPSHRVRPMLYTNLGLYLF
jgi:hypothetical protein